MRSSNAWARRWSIEGGAARTRGRDEDRLIGLRTAQAITPGTIPLPHAQRSRLQTLVSSAGVVQRCRYAAQQTIRAAAAQCNVVMSWAARTQISGNPICFRT